MYPGHVANSLGKPLDGFEHSVEIIVLEQFCAAILQDFAMDSSALKFHPDRSGPLLCLVEGLRRFALPHFAVLTIFQPRKGEDGIELLPMALKLLASTNEARRDQEGLDKIND